MRAVIGAIKYADIILWGARSQGTVADYDISFPSASIVTPQIDHAFSVYLAVLEKQGAVTDHLHTLMSEDTVP